jgi:hypothetical protein
MAVTLNTAPAEIAFSKNEILVKLLSDDFRTGVPAASVNALAFTGAIAPETVIQLNWVGGAATMTAKAAPDESGLTFLAGDGSWAYVQSLVDYFAGNAFVDRDFETVADENAGGSPRLLFTSKTNSPDFDFIAGGNISILTHGVSDATRDNFCHHVQIPIGSDKLLCFDANVQLDTRAAGLTTIDIHEALDGFLSPERPVLNSAYTECTESIKPYSIKFAQFYGSPQPTIRKVYRSTGYYVNLGGLGLQAAATGDLLSELRPNLADRSTWRCLRQGSKNKLTRREQPEWLVWINLGDAAVNVQLEVTITNDDESTATFTSAAAFAAAAFGKYQFAAGFTQLAIAGRQAADKKPLYYTARVKGPDGYLSAPYLFVIDYTYQEWSRFFVYYNALGGFTTIGTVGKAQPGFDRSADVAQLATGRRAAAITGDFMEANITIRDKTTVNYGYRRSNTRDLNLLREFFTSPAVFEYQDGQAIPIQILTKSLNDAPDGTNVYGSSFEYSPKYPEETFTEKPGQADTPLGELLGQAGSPIPIPDPEGGTVPDGAVIRVLYGDDHLGISGGQQIYTAPARLTGRTGYAIYSSQLGRLFYMDEISYNPGGGSFTILVDQLLLQVGDYLSIWPYVLDPDSLFV